MSAIIALACCIGAEAQDKIIHPDITYAGTPRDLVIGGFNVSGMDGYEDYILQAFQVFPLANILPFPETKLPKP